MNRIICLAATLLLAMNCWTSALAQTKPAQALANSQSSSVGSGAVAEHAVPEEFVIGVGDILAVNVWKEAEISKVVPVRSDGRISLPLIGEVLAGGRTPRQLEVEVTKKLKDYVAQPEVTIVVQEIKSQKFNILGMVSHPGSFPLTRADDCC